MSDELQQLTEALEVEVDLADRLAWVLMFFTSASDVDRLQSAELGQQVMAWRRQVLDEHFARRYGHANSDGELP